jgi:hypothetical protein
MVNAIQANEKAEQEFLAKIEKLDQDVAKSRPEQARLKQTENTAGQLEKLRSAEPVTQKRIMRSFVRKVIVDRDKTKIFGSVDYRIGEKPLKKTRNRLGI